MNVRDRETLLFNVILREKRLNIEGYHHIQGNTKLGRRGKSTGGAIGFMEHKTAHGTSAPACITRRQLQIVHMTNFYKGVNARISTGRASFVKCRTKNHLPTLAAAISHFVFIASATIITAAIHLKL